MVHGLSLRNSKIRRARTSVSGKRIHLIVAEIKRVDIFDADNVGGSAQLGGIAMAGLAGGKIVGILLVVGDADQVRRVAFGDHFGDRAAGENREIVGVGGDDGHGAPVIGLGVREPLPRLPR